MATSTLVPLRDYLTTSYRPDREWIDGEIRERHVGEGPHSVLQKFFILFFGALEGAWNVRVLPEQRVQTSTSHYRIPDVCVVRASDPFEAIVRVAPLLCIEILSPDDRMSEIQERVEDYFGMGVLAVWVIDPRRRKVFAAAADGALHPIAETMTVAGTGIRVPVNQLFAELDRLEGRN